MTGLLFLVFSEITALGCMLVIHLGFVLILPHRKLFMQSIAMGHRYDLRSNKKLIKRPSIES